jgi:integrase
MVTTSHHPSIGDYRKIRLNPKPNAGGYWEVWWTDHGAGSVTKKQSTKTQDRAEAEAYLAEFCADLRSIMTAPAPGRARALTVDELSAKWLVHAAGAGKGNATYILTAPRRELGGYTADYLAGSAGSVLLQEYASKRVNKANGTIRRELGALQTVLRWAARPSVGLIAPGDVPTFDGLLPPQGAPRTAFLDPVQEQWFWDQAMAWGHKDHGYKHAQDAARRVMVFIALGLETSARYQAIVELTWDRVNLSLGFVDYQVPGKRITKKRRVKVPISDRLMPVLQEAWLKAPKDPRGQAKGRVLEGAKYMRGGFTTFTAAVGMEWVTPHVLRHTWASLAAMNGVPLRDIGLIMGDTTAVIEATYLHLTPGHLKSAINHKAKPAAAPLRLAG